MSQVSPEFLQTFFGNSSLSQQQQQQQQQQGQGQSQLPPNHHSSLPPPLQHGSGSNLPPLSHPHTPSHSHHMHQLQIPAFSRLTEGGSPAPSSLGVSPRNIYNQSPRTDDEEDHEESNHHATRPVTPSLSTHNAAPSDSVLASPSVSTPATGASSLPLAVPLMEGGEIYAAVYSGIGVYETMANAVAVMRRKSDGYLNATQILKVAGVDKGRRTKILDKEVMIGEHEKVQGGYGKYQGTWVPFERGVQLALQYGVDRLLQPLFNFAFPAPGRSDHTPTKEQVYAANRDLLKQRSSGSAGQTKGREDVRKKRPTTRPTKRMVELVDGTDPMDEDSVEAVGESPSGANKRQKGDGYSEVMMETNAEKYRAMLMAMFVHEDPLYIPDILSGTTLPSDLNLDIVIDEQGHTSLHWAAALARINVVRVLLQKGADMRSVNNDGETALIRAVRVTNNYDTQTFPELLDLLHPMIHLVDSKNRTVLHHIAATAGLEGRVAASRYYVECFLEWVARHGGNFSSIVDVQDNAGDTALNVAARIGNRNLVEQLMDVGADATIENKAGLRPMDFGFEDIFGSSRHMHLESTGEADRSAEGTSRVVFPSIRTDEEDAALALSAVASATKGREIASVQQMVDEMSTTFTDEMKIKGEQLEEVRNQLRQVTKELADVRKQNHLLRRENQQLPEMVQRIKNLETCLGEEMARAGNSGASSHHTIPNRTPGTVEYRNDASGSSNAPGGMVSYLSHDSTTDPHHTGLRESSASSTAPPSPKQHELHALRRTLSEKEQLERTLRSEIIRLRSSSGKSELSCKKIIAACCHVPVEHVDDLLNPLLQAVESDAEVDMNAVAAFMMAVKRKEGRAFT
ncbi:hypothetical protein PhCBS80983_g05440 [Powellomyces hirtus]|uniref:HTH APSES-type domain-containing protein n=1 Tax=Powellomyces hirtus TaxID=109895 RepID=A0A507DU93_9FUNG|nr:hypothetical protein PhCBS80983_g05440 [Powellomyces hirtus]